MDTSSVYSHRQDGSLWVVYAIGAFFSFLIMIELVSSSPDAQFTIILIVSFSVCVVWFTVMSFAFKYLAIEADEDSLKIYFGPLKYVFCGCQSENIKFNLISRVTLICDDYPQCCYCSECDRDCNDCKSGQYKCCSYEGTMGVHFGMSTKYYGVSKWLFSPIKLCRDKNADDCKNCLAFSKRATFEIIFKQRAKCCCYSKVVVTTDDPKGLIRVFEANKIAWDDQCGRLSTNPSTSSPSNGPTDPPNGATNVELQANITE